MHSGCGPSAPIALPHKCSAFCQQARTGENLRCSCKRGPESCNHRRPDTAVVNQPAWPTLFINRWIVFDRIQICQYSQAMIVSLDRQQRLVIFQASFAASFANSRGSICPRNSAHCSPESLLNNLNRSIISIRTPTGRIDTRDISSSRLWRIPYPQLTIEPLFQRFMNLSGTSCNTFQDQIRNCRLPESKLQGPLHILALPSARKLVCNSRRKPICSGSRLFF